MVHSTLHYILSVLHCLIYSCCWFWFMSYLLIVRSLLLQAVNRYKGANYPIMNLHERVLSVLTNRVIILHCWFLLHDALYSGFWKNCSILFFEKLCKKSTTCNNFWYATSWGDFDIGRISPVNVAALPWEVCRKVIFDSIFCSMAK